MKYLKKFNSIEEYLAYLEGGEMLKPNVSYVANNNIAYNKLELDTPLYIEAIDDITVSFSLNNIEYSLDNLNWQELPVDTDTPTVRARRKVYFRATGLTPSSSTGIGTFSIKGGDCNVGGNAMSMLYGKDYAGQTILKEGAFARLFANASIVSADKLKLVASTVSRFAYNQMFLSCNKLVVAPQLPATKVLGYAYQSMFNGCSSLEIAPELPFTSLAEYSCWSMFRSCTSLKVAPALPVKSLSSHCCESMFCDCTSLVNVPMLPATSLAYGCYKGMFKGCISLIEAPDLPATSLAEYCYNEMFSGCISLTVPPALIATTVKDYCYKEMFSGCTNLLTAPELIATNLERECYWGMFKDCTSLTTAPELLSTDSSWESYSHMFRGCTSLVNAPSVLPLTNISNYDYAGMFANCINLEVAPVIKAVTAGQYAFENMFNGCSKLSRIECMYTGNKGYHYTYQWVKDVATEGVFIKNPEATWPSGEDGIPSGWTIQDAVVE
jgi:hypothetical protein